MKSGLSIFLGVMCLLGCHVLQAQSRLSYGAKISYSVNGLFQSDAPDDRLKTDLILPGPAFTIGMKHHYYLNENRTIGIGIGMLYEHSAFTKLKIEDYGDGFQFKRKQRFRNQYILMPLDVVYHYKKLSFSAGIIYTSVLSIQLKSKYCYASPDSGCKYQEGTTIDFKINDANQLNELLFSPVEQAFVDDRSNLQYQAGLHYQLNDRMRLGVEYRDFIFENFLTVVSIGLDVINRVQYKYQTNTVDLSFLYSIN